MFKSADFKHVAATAAWTALSLLVACGGEMTSEPAEEPSLEGQRVTGEEQALEIVARGVVAPIRYSELAHAVLARAFALLAQRPQDAADAVGACDTATGWGQVTLLDRDGNHKVSGADRITLTAGQCQVGTRAQLSGAIGIDIEAADNAEGLMLRAESGSLRVHLNFDDVVLDASSARIDGALVLQVWRTPMASSVAHASHASALAVTTGGQSMRWSHLNVQVDAQGSVQTLVVASDVPGPGGPLWLDATSSAPGRFVVAGVIGFLKARMTLQVAADGAWAIEVDNDKDDAIDFVVRAQPAQTRFLLPGV
jgi:hypothetical protein